MSLFDGYQINQEITSAIKVYPDFVRLFHYKTPFIIRRHDYDEKRQQTTRKHKLILDEEERQDREDKNLRRAKTMLTDLTLCNAFDLFATFTFKKDRYNIKAKKRQMAYWLNNQRILHGNFAYIIVAEYHKDGKALHFHALFSDFKGKLKDSGKFIKGRKSYNFTGYRAGINSATKIESLEKVSSYVSKYITKEMATFSGKQRYWCSNGLKRPIKILNPDFTEAEKALFTQVRENDRLTVLEYRGDLLEDTIKRNEASRRKREDDLWVSEW